MWILSRLVVYGYFACQRCLSLYSFNQICGKQNMSSEYSRVMRSVCPCWCTLIYCFHNSLFPFLCILFFGVLFQHVFNIAVPGWGQIDHLVLLLKPRKSKLCLWITIHQNKFPQHPPHKALITEESLFYLCLSHFWPCFWSTSESGPYLVCPVFNQTEGYFMQPFSLSWHL